MVFHFCRLAQDAGFSFLRMRLARWQRLLTGVSSCRNDQAGMGLGRPVFVAGENFASFLLTEAVVFPHSFAARPFKARRVD